MSNIIGSILWNVDISFLVCAYNAELTIEKCLFSIINGIEKSKLKCEIIFIDDGSTDATKKKVEAISHTQAKIRMYTQQNQGSAISRNKALELSKGEFVYYVDSDDTINSENILSALFNYREVSVDAIRGGWTSVSRVQNLIPELELRDLTKSNSFQMMTMFWEMGFWRYIYRREFLTQKQIFFSPSFSDMKFPFVLDDFFFLLTFVANKPLVQDVNEIFYYYNDGRDQSKYFSQQIKMQPRAIRKYLLRNRIMDIADPIFTLKILKYRLDSSFRRSKKDLNLVFNFKFTQFLLIIKYLTVYIRIRFKR